MPRTNHVLRNPHINAGRALQARSGLELGRCDYEDAARNPPKPCGCGETTWYKPTVGAYVCRCGAITR